MALRVAGAQMPVTRDIDANVRLILSAIDFAVGERADVLLTPEGSVSGYTHEFDQTQVEAALEEVLERAREARLALALGTCFVEPEDGRCYNQIRFYDRDCRFLGFHSKTLTCGSWDEPPQGEINHYAVSPLRTFELGGICVGGLICNDLWANPQCTPQPDPHLTQQLSRMGARVIFHSVNGGRDGSEWTQLSWHYHESNLRMRARAGAVWIVTVDSADPLELPCSAPSGVIDPEGNWLVKAPPQGEQHFVAALDLD